jgi:site-specific DNA-methyltransferase (adenine-specific)
LYSKPFGNFIALHTTEYRYKLFSYINDLVFDPFCGSGTTLIQAFKNSRRVVGVEIDAKYCELARNRIIQEIGSIDFVKK